MKQQSNCFRALPPYKTLKLKIDPHQGAAMLVGAIDPPEGYAFISMKRDMKGNVTAKYIRMEETA